MLRISLMSAPAVERVRMLATLSSTASHPEDLPAKAFSLPVMTIAPTLGSSSAAAVAWLSSVKSSELSALSALGRLSLMSVTPLPADSTMMLEYSEGEAGGSAAMKRGMELCRLRASARLPLLRLTVMERRMGARSEAVAAENMMMLMVVVVMSVERE